MTTPTGIEIICYDQCGHRHPNGLNRSVHRD